ncbi:hypothetical protein VNO77_03278 [Canavalia gladiata]|uniref:Uncharacterized protein n=1 Tax=Canavalia gladiata TaxID=3824 RepID=A0AAN9MUG4_CANGL
MARVRLLLMIGSLGLVFMAHRIGVTSALVPSLVLVVQRGLLMLDRPCPCSTSPVLHDVKHMTTCLCSTESLCTAYNSWNAPNLTAPYIPIIPLRLDYYNLSIANASHPTLSQAHVLRPFGFSLLKFANGLQPVTMLKLLHIPPDPMLANRNRAEAILANPKSLPLPSLCVFQRIASSSFDFSQFRSSFLFFFSQKTSFEKEKKPL